jgi:hypothetical protein
MWLVKPGGATPRTDSLPGRLMFKPRSPRGAARSIHRRNKLFSAIGESLKNLGKLTSGALFAAHPEIDWKGAMGFRDVIAHRYFDIDAEQVWWIRTP